MKKYCFLFIVAAAFTCFMSCNEPANENATTAAKDSVTFDLSKARSWVESDNQKFEEEFKKGDSNALAAHYAADAMLMFSNSEPMRGTEIATGWGQAIRMGAKELKVTTVDLIGNADLLAETGAFEVYGDNNKLLDKGKYVVIWKPADGGWKIYRDIGNSNMPPMKK